MVGKQLEKVLKSIERQLFKLVLSHALKTLASLSVRILSIRNNSKSPTLSVGKLLSMGHVTGKKALKSHQGNYTNIETKVKNMTTKKATSSQQVLLSAKKLAELGNELTDIMNVLEMNNLALEGLEFALQNDTTTFLWLAKKYTDTAYAQNEKLYDRLNEISFLLLNNDNAKELEAYHD